MKIEQKLWRNNTWETIRGNDIKETAQLVLVFGSRKALKTSNISEVYKEMYPNAHCIMGSTAGEIIDIEVYDDSLSLTAVEFERTTMTVVSADIEEDSEMTGKKVAEMLTIDNLKHVFILSDGLHINGTALIRGLEQVLPKHISITGGLSGDGPDFKETWVGLDNTPSERKIIALGLYGENLKVGYSSRGGWQRFGVKRIITKSKANILYELDGEPALELYKNYLGEQSLGLPASALLFPLEIAENEASAPLVRTILAIDEDQNTMTFAGDIPEGGIAYLMRTDYEGLAAGAMEASKNSMTVLKEEEVELALLVSCVGRKLVMKQWVEDEVEAVRGVVGEHAAITGFYSYGELAPASEGGNCLLHNQTMTLTLFSETN